MDGHNSFMGNYCPKSSKCHYLNLNNDLHYRIFLDLRYQYMRKNAITAPTIMPAVVNQKANCNQVKREDDVVR